MAKKVLFVDDDETFRGVMYDVLSGRSHKVTLAKSGKEALEHLSNGFIFDVVIVDLNMPGMDGIQLTRLIRQKSQVPIFLNTGDERAEYLISGIEKIKIADKTFEGINSMLEELDSASE